jgi:hypothetical protein
LARFFKEVGAGAPLVAFAQGDGSENLVAADAGHFGVHAELNHIDTIESVDLHQEAPVPWAGDPSKRPGVFAKIRNSNIRLWPRFQIVGTSEYGWTRVWVPQQVRRAAFHGGQPSPVEILGRAQVGPPGTVEDTLGVKLSGRMVASTWNEKKPGDLPGQKEFLRRWEAMLRLTGPDGNSIDIPFNEIASLKSSGGPEPFKLDVLKTDGARIRGDLKANTGSWNEADIQVVMDWGFALVSWQDIKSITFQSPR